MPPTHASVVQLSPSWQSCAVLHTPPDDELELVLVDVLVEVLVLVDVLVEVLVLVEVPVDVLDGEPPAPEPPTP